MSACAIQSTTIQSLSINVRENFLEDLENLFVLLNLCKHVLNCAELDLGDTNINDVEGTHFLNLGLKL